MKIKLAIAGLAACTVLSLTGCASGYQQFYRPVPGATAEEISAQRAAPPTGAPLVERASSKVPPESIVDAYARRGYVLIGSSSFNSGNAERDEAAIEQARKVGADLVVLIDPKYTGTVTGSVPITTPTTTTSYTTGSATAYGRGGAVTAIGNSTTTTYGTQTNYVPFAVHRSDYSAGFFIKRRWQFGALWRDLNDAERKTIQSNKGVVVRTVVEGTPAYLADVLPDDIIIAVDGNAVLGQAELSRLLTERAGREVTLTVYRNGTQRPIAVKLN